MKKILEKFVAFLSAFSYITLDVAICIVNFASSMVFTQYFDCRENILILDIPGGTSDYLL